MRFEELISAIKKRPKMYIQEEKVEYIYYLLLGYRMADVNIDTDELGQQFHCWFSKWITMWIKENVDSEYISKTAYWYDDIKVIANDEKNELSIFFELYEMFLEDYNKKIGYFEWKNE